LSINAGYVIGQLARALRAAGGEQRVAKWTKVLEGIESGRLRVGSRTPVESAPAWVTLEVVTGGFATGTLAAGNPDPERNAHGLTDEGRAGLLEQLRSGAYSVQVPEEAALLTLALLIDRGRGDDAAALLDALVPFFDRVRFYPAAAQAERGEKLQRSTPAEVAELLEKKPQSERITRMNEALTTRAALRERVVALLLETVDGEAPRLVEASEKHDRANEGWSVEGGWPGKPQPAAWKSRARAAIGEAKGARGSLGLLVDHLEKLATGTVSRRQLGSLRRLLAGELRKRGAPYSEQRTRLRVEQQRIARLPTHGELRKQAAARLRAGDTRLDDLGLPPSIAATVARCIEGTVEELVERGIISSGDVLATLLPRLVARIRAGDFDEPAGRLYARTYEAFRRRRSLLLLNLEGQVRFEELPWVRALETLRTGASSGAAAAAALSVTASLALGAFPYAVLTNKLITELRALAKSAGIDLPLVEELAADIFVGRFGPGFLAAAKVAARVMNGSLYARYYGVPYDRVTDLPALCRELAGVSGGSVAANGTLIEQQQIITTQNLAVLFDALPLHVELVPMAKRTFEWMLWRLKGGQQPTLSIVKNVAYAWRQLVFYLSRAGEEAHAPFIAWANERLGRARGPYQRRLERAVRGLELAVSGADPGTLRFLGWTTTGHWLRETG